MKKLLISGISIYLLGIILIYWDGLHSEYDSATYAVILGNKIYPNGKPAERTYARVTRAAQLYHQGKVKKIITSGGIGYEKQDEAKVMAELLEKLCVPKSAIIIDSQGYNTRQTALNAKQWIRPSDSVIAVSQAYHLSRTKLAFRQAGFEHIGSAYADYFEWRDIYTGIRALPAWLSYFFKVK